MRPVSRPSLALVALLLLGAVLTGALAWSSGGRAAAEDAALEFGPYLQRVDGRTADPVNLIFTGERDAVALALKLGGMLRWAPIRGSEMSFQDRGVTRWADVQLGAMEPGGVRRHMRLGGATTASERWGPYTLAAVHRDIPVACGHIGAAFDSERDAVVATLRGAGYSVRWLWLGNTDGVEHCDGASTRGDGWAAVIEVKDATVATSTPPASPSPVAAPTSAPAPASTPSPAPAATASSPPTPSPSPLPSPTQRPAPTASPPEMPEPPSPMR